MRLDCVAIPNNPQRWGMTDQTQLRRAQTSGTMDPGEVSIDEARRFAEQRLSDCLAAPGKCHTDIGKGRPPD